MHMLMRYFNVFQRFGTIETVCENMHTDNYGRYSLDQRLFAGALASILETLLIGAPMETVMTQVIKDKSNPSPKLKGAFAAFGHILNKHGEAFKAYLLPNDRWLPSFFLRLRRTGIAGLYRGTYSIIARQVMIQVIRMAVFESGRNVYYVHNPGEKIPLATLAGLGATSGMISVLCTAPLDFIKTRMQGLFWTRYRSYWDCAKKVYRKEGFSAFFRGSALRMLRVSVDLAYTSVFYECMMNNMERKQLI